MAVWDIGLWKPSQAIRQQIVEARLLNAKKLTRLRSGHQLIIIVTFRTGNAIGEAFIVTLRTKRLSAGSKMIFEVV